MRILGIDYGDARTGLSISDPSGFLAGSPSVIHEWNRSEEPRLNSSHAT